MKIISVFVRKLASFGGGGPPIFPKVAGSMLL
jgi:hypothetical protein